LFKNQNVELEILDVLGKSVQTISIYGNVGLNSVIIDSAPFAKGTYRIQLNGESVTATLPFVKL